MKNKQPNTVIELEVYKLDHKYVENNSQLLW